MAKFRPKSKSPYYCLVLIKKNPNPLNPIAPHQSSLYLSIILYHPLSLSTILSVCLSLARSHSTSNLSPSAMSPPFTAVETSSSPFPSDLNDDSKIESEELLSLCKKTLIEADFVTSAMRSCISDGYSELNRRLFGDSIHDDGSLLCESDLWAIIPDSVPNDSFPPETEFDLEALLRSEESFLDDSIVPETEFQIQALPEKSMQNLRKRKASGGGAGASTEEPATEKAAEQEVFKRAKYPPLEEAMMRILLPVYFLLVRSFPNLFIGTEN